MILSDGTTDITVTQANEVFRVDIEKSTTTAAGGRLKSQTAGKRIGFKVDIRTTQAVYASILTLLTNGAAHYYYTPEETYALFSSVTFPIEVNVTNLKRDWDNRTAVYVSFDAESIDYY